MSSHQIAKRWEMSKLGSFVTSFSTVAVLCIGLGTSSVARGDYDSGRDDDGHINMDRVFFPVFPMEKSI